MGSGLQGSGDRAGYESWLCLPLTRCVTLGKKPVISELQFPPPYSGDNMAVGATFLTTATVILTTEGETRDTRKDLTSLGPQDGVGSPRVVPACPGSQAPEFLRRSPLSCVSQTLPCSGMLLNAGSGVPPVELLVWNLFSPGESEAGHCEGDQLSRFA